MVMTRMAPPRPSYIGPSETQVKLLTKAGMANGRHSTTFQKRRAGRSLRSTHQARARPSRALSRVTPNISHRVLPSKRNT